MDEKKNEELKAQIKEKKNMMLSLAKDRHFMEKLIGDILSLKGQMGVEPAHYFVALNDVIDTMESDEYRIHMLNNGVHFETKGGLDIFIDAKYRAACGFLSDIVSTKDMMKDLNDEDKDAYYTSLKNVMYVLCAPLWVLGSQAMTTFMGNALLVMLSAQEEWMCQEDEEKRKMPIPTRLIASRIKEMCNMLLTHIDAQNGKETGQTEEGKKEEE